MASTTTSGLVDQYGRPIDTTRLTTEEATPALTGVRSIFSNHPARGLTPEGIASILLEAEQTDATRYLELAEDMEERDLNYLAQLGTRKRAIAQLQFTVVSASDDENDVANADLVRAMLARDDVEEIVFDVLDAIGKGYSVTEIIWERSATQWMPKCLEWRDPRWFMFDRTDGRTLMLRDGASLLPLTPYKYIVHRPKAKSGLSVRGGLARAASWAYLFKIIALKDWVVLAEVYGQPYRVGRYHPGATADEKSTLLRAVSQLGTDAAAILPQSMMLEIIESAKAGSGDVYSTLTAYLDAQVTKAILGQTLTSDVSSNGGSRALGDVHNEVRRDIMRADARSLAATFNDQLIRPLVDLNRGPQEAYPKLVIGLPDELSTAEKFDALTKLVPLGLRVSMSSVRDQLGYEDPEDDDEVLVAPAPVPTFGLPGAPPAPSPVAPPAGKPALAAAAQLKAMLAQARAAQASGSLTTAAPPASSGVDSIDLAVRESLGDGGWEAQVQPITDEIRQLLEQCQSIDELRDKLLDAIGRMDVNTFATAMGNTGFATRVAGLLGIPLGR